MCAYLCMVAMYVCLFGVWVYAYECMRECVRVVRVIAASVYDVFWLLVNVVWLLMRVLQNVVRFLFDCWNASCESDLCACVFYVMFVFMCESIWSKHVILFIVGVSWCRFVRFLITDSYSQIFLPKSCHEWHLR